jgi:hypothetical protein
MLRGSFDQKTVQNSQSGEKSAHQIVNRLFLSFFGELDLIKDLV